MDVAGVESDQAELKGSVKARAHPSNRLLTGGVMSGAGPVRDGQKGILPKVRIGDCEHATCQPRN